MDDILLFAQAEVSEWTPWWVAAIITLSSLVGGAISWLWTTGMDRYMKYREWKAKQNALETKPFSTEQMWEDKTLAMGYKALLYNQDRRIRELEDRDIQRTKEMQGVHTQLLNCLTEHAETNARYAACQRDLEEERKYRQSLERKFQKLGERVNIKLDDEPDSRETSGV